MEAEAVLLDRSPLAVGVWDTGTGLLWSNRTCREVMGPDEANASTLSRRQAQRIRPPSSPWSG
ncbi:MULTISPECIES: hypothetical protein [unclassified Streptomyces]|uniref:hypothetical protein n=1 Tax=unclassified Streptomyces TaxID=2593676 RepID=UPI00114D3C00|nr:MULTISPECIES: hypothetical protein [unclassified Streptomyces]MYS23720.1 hypothetical protein [Streptomyces sp. SID4948]